MNSRTRVSRRRTIFQVLVGVIFLAPMLWLLSGSIQPPGLASGRTPHSISLIPPSLSVNNYWRIFEVYDIGRPLLNSSLVVIFVVPLTILTASGAGFAMTQLPSQMRRWLLLLTIVLMIVPLPALWLPRFVLYSAVGLIDTLAVLILPSLMGTSPFFVLLFYWTFRRIQAGIFDAARLDGASTIRIWWSIALPMAKTTASVVAVLTFALYWGDYMGSLIYLRSESLYTLPLRLQLLMTQDIANQPLAMAATVVSIFPIIMAFLWVQRYFWPEGRS